MDTAMQAIVETALQQGLWAALYIYLFFRMLRESKDREERYQTLIDRLSCNIQEGIEDIQNRLDVLAKQKPDPSTGQPTNHGGKREAANALFSSDRF